MWSLVIKQHSYMTTIHAARRCVVSVCEVCRVPTRSFFWLSSALKNRKNKRAGLRKKKTEEQYSSTPGDTMKEIKYFPGRIQQTHWIPTRISPACFPHKYSQTCINMDQRGIQHRYCLLLQLLFSNHYTSRKITIKLMWPISNLEIHVQDLEVSDCDLVMICRHTVSDNFINI